MDTLTRENECKKMITIITITLIIYRTRLVRSDREVIRISLSVPLFRLCLFIRSRACAAVLLVARRWVSRQRSHSFAKISITVYYGVLSSAVNIARTEIGRRKAGIIWTCWLLTAEATRISCVSLGGICACACAWFCGWYMSAVRIMCTFFLLHTCYRYDIFFFSPPGWISNGFLNTLETKLWAMRELWV